MLVFAAQTYSDLYLNVLLITFAILHYTMLYTMERSGRTRRNNNGNPKQGQFVLFLRLLLVIVTLFCELGSAQETAAPTASETMDNTVPSTTGTAAPTAAVIAGPTTSPSPVSTMIPTLMPSTSLLESFEAYITMVLQNVNSDVTPGVMSKWESLTSSHIEEFWNTIQTDTFFVGEVQTHSITIRRVDDDQFWRPTWNFRNDTVPLVDPLNDFLPRPQDLQINYNQTITYSLVGGRSVLDDTVWDALDQQLYLLPFQWNSYSYLEALESLTNNSIPILLKAIVISSLPALAPTQAPGNQQATDEKTIITTVVITLVSLVFAGSYIIYLTRKESHDATTSSGNQQNGTVLPYVYDDDDDDTSTESDDLYSSRPIYYYSNNNNNHRNKGLQNGSSLQKYARSNTTKTLTTMESAPEDLNGTASNAAQDLEEAADAPAIVNPKLVDSDHHHHQRVRSFISNVGSSSTGVVDVLDHAFYNDDHNNNNNDTPPMVVVKNRSMMTSGMLSRDDGLSESGGSADRAEMGDLHSNNNSHHNNNISIHESQSWSVMDRQGGESMSYHHNQRPSPLVFTGFQMEIQDLDD